MEIRLSAPSKTFLVGEYLALSGGPSIVLNTTPRFELVVRTKGEGRCEGIHPNSPAGKWVRQNNEAFFKVDMEFIDPHMGRGGFGASSAQFMLAYAWEELSGRRLDDGGMYVDPQEMWKSYRAIVAEGGGVSPSGADVIGQWQGMISQFSHSPFSVAHREWVFADLKFAVLRTGHKIATHKHLQELSGLPVERLQQLVSDANEGFVRKSSSHLVEAVRAYGGELENLGLVAPSTAEILRQVKSLKGIAAAKGCGALGADTILVLYNPSANTAEAIAGALSLELVATDTGVSPGLQMQVAWRGARPQVGAL